MKKQIVGALCAGVFLLGLISSANAALVGLLPATPGGTDYQAVYDTDLDITWLADSNLPASQSFGITGISASGLMKWSTANTWLAALNIDGGTGYLGFSDWRLPSTPDTSGIGYNLNGSELGHIYYDELGGTPNNSIQSSGDPDLGLFQNLDGGYIWSNAYPFSPNFAWAFYFGGGSGGYQSNEVKEVREFRVWAVRSGGISTVPVPATVWLFGSGLIGLIGMAKRKKV